MSASRKETVSSVRRAGPKAAFARESASFQVAMDLCAPSPGSTRDGRELIDRLLVDSQHVGAPVRGALLLLSV